jgi:hypothetical protein
MKPKRPHSYQSRCAPQWKAVSAMLRRTTHFSGWLVRCSGPRSFKSARGLRKSSGTSELECNHPDREIDHRTYDEDRADDYSRMPKYRTPAHIIALLRNCIYSGVCEHRIVVAHLNQAHRFQFFQMGRLDRKQFPAFCPDVPEGPTEVDSFLNVEVVERVVVVGHFAQSLTECSTNCKPAGTVLFPARCERLVPAIILTENPNRLALTQTGRTLCPISIRLIR